MITPTLSRRHLLLGAGLLGTATAVGALPGLAAPASADLVDLLVAPTFVPLVGKEFRFYAPWTAAVPLTLAAVEGLGGDPVARRAFCLRFHGPVAAKQGGAVGQLSTDGYPPFNLLVVPSGQPVPAGQDWVVTVQGDRRG